MIFELKSAVYGEIRYFEANRCFNTEELRKFNKGKITCEEIVSFDCGLFNMYEMDSPKQGLRDETEQVIALILRPTEESFVALKTSGFEFCGYDLVESGSTISAITNCGGDFNSIPYGKLTRYGLLPNYKDAVLAQLALVEEDPDEPHADCDIYEIWRKTV